MTPEQILKEMEADPMFFGLWYFKNHLREQTPLFHVDLIDSAMHERHFAVAAPRESAKSTMLCFLYTFHAICFKRKRFIIMVGNTLEKASEHLDTIKKEILDNEKKVAEEDDNTAQVGAFNSYAKIAELHKDGTFVDGRTVNITVDSADAESMAKLADSLAKLRALREAKNSPK